MTCAAAEDRYQQIPYRRSGRSGLLPPEVSLGLWQNFGDDRGSLGDMMSRTSGMAAIRP